MSTAPSPAPAWSVATKAIAAAAVLALAVITLASPGATRMYESPWSWVHGFALLVPAVLLIWRAFDARHALVLPRRAWCVLAFGLTTVVLASAAVSPYRASCLLWSAPLLSAVAVFFLAFDWLQSGPDSLEGRQFRLLTGAGVFLAVIALTSMGMWALNLSPPFTASHLSDIRNPFPLGHSNYTAGIALLMLPCFASLAWRRRGAARAAWMVAAGLALASLFTSGSRGGLIGFAVLVVVFIPIVTRALRLKLWMVILAGLLVVGALLYWNPRLRAMVLPTPAGAEPNLSNVQRTAMLTAGLRMGDDRPWLGWGPGATPLAFPRYRAGLEGGAENVLQLHSVPAQLWAELGAGGIIVALALLGLAIQSARPSREARAVLLAFSGYAVFSLTDWQLDVPVFAFALAIGAACVAPIAPRAAPGLRRALGFATVAALAVVIGFGRVDPAPDLNVEALALAAQPGLADRAIALLNESLALNPDQEIAHFNLGWLLVVRDPAAAEQHFLAAAHLVPDKGGVYFGLGLARFNRDQRAGAVQAFALESINDPLFLTSPWWRTTAFAGLREETSQAVVRMTDEVSRQEDSRDRRIAVEARYLATLTRWLAGRKDPGEPLGRAHTAERVAYFVHQPDPPAFDAAPIHFYRRERIGYPVLMRNLDLPVPVDLFDVQENSLASDQFRFLFPAKGWLPAPLLLELLDHPSH
jgi:tetratricopeptide (TPR) repeat protein